MLNGILPSHTRCGRTLAYGGGVIMALSAAAPPALADQRVRPVVALECAADLSLCRELVQTLAEIAPRSTYRINPSPTPSDAFTLRLEQADDGRAFLTWQEDGTGHPVSVTGLTDPELAARLVAASAGLPDALRMSQ